ncbi:MAG: hypothetical protein HDS38_01775 [Bacteroides sp.]|nr:hypothetical protein [Bacteroides sp.]
MAEKSFNKRNIHNRILIGALALAAGVSVAKGDLLSAGREAFMNYDFEGAMENYEKYAKSLKKTPSAEGEQLLEEYLRQLEIAENSLDNVQKIEIIDRIDVPAEDYIKYIKLPSVGGRLLSPDASMLKERQNQSDFGYATESGDLMMWSEMNEDGLEAIMQSDRLMDGSWETPRMAGDILNDGGSARNPFMLNDGVTLYYSSDGDGSMGGYDLFVATKDPTSGEFRQPIGLGYPFNSPFNEYMMAIDEDNGIGWWVTDRNRLDGKVSVYIFKTNDVRKNYVTDEEDDIVSLARVDDISVTQNPDTDYAKILKGIDERSRGTKQARSSDFIFPMPGGRVARRLSDFSDAGAKRGMQQYLQALGEYEQLEGKLTQLRKKYHSTDRKKGSSTALSHQILELEKKRDELKESLKQIRNSVISSETKQ